MEHTRNFVGFLRTVIGMALGIACLVGFCGNALAQGYDEQQVYQSVMMPWKYAAHALDGTLAAWDKAYRVTYGEDAVKTPSERGCYSQNVTKNIAKDDDTFYEPGNYKVENPHVTIDISFGTVKEFQQIVYGSRNDNGNTKGFANEFNVYVSTSDTLPTTVGDNGWKLVAHGTGNTTAQLCVFEVCPENEVVAARHVRFEFVKSHNNYPSCRALRFYAHDPHEHDLETLWKDYTQTSFKEGLDVNKVNEIIQTLQKTPSYEVTYKPYIDRALAVARGEVHYEQELERSNEAHQETPSSQAFLRIGDLAGYARNTLKFPNGCTNRQVTGIWYPSNTVAHIWVYAENENDPLPKVSFAQPYGYWASWLASGVQLKPGENLITIPNRKTLDYKTYDIVAGMACYIENPYNKEEQTGEVKIYFEGGRTFPVYHLGDDVTAYMASLRAHADRVRADRTAEMDVTELVSNHVMMTVQATRADELYGSRGHDAKANLEEWNKTIHRCLEFEGICMDPNRANDPEAHYDIRNQYLNENYRVSQVWDGGWMFTAGEHIGVYTGESAQDVLIDCIDKYGNSTIGPNWGLIHEWGHSVDIPARSIQETTNNMAPYYESTFYPEFRRNEEDIYRANRMALPTYEQGTMFAENRYNFMPFWLVESYWPGWWGKVSNLYRYTPQDEANGFTVANGKVTDNLTKTERMVLYASLASGYDLRYWYERWGLNIDQKEKPFTRDSASEAFNQQWAAHQNDIKTTYDDFDEKTPLPLWYQDRDQYLKVAAAQTAGKRESLRIYRSNEENKPELLGIRHGTKTVTKEVDGKKETETYETVNITIRKNEDPMHLCYVVECREKGTDGEWTNAGYTHGGVFTDERKLGSEEAFETYEYRVCAMDRSLHTSAWSDAIAFGSAQNVAEVTYPVWTKDGQTVSAKPTEGEWSESQATQTFTDLGQAIEFAWEHKGTHGEGTVDIIANCTASEIVLSDKKIILRPKGANVDLGRGSEGKMFDVQANATLTIEGKANDHVLTVDGYLAGGTTAAITVGGSNALLKAHNVTFENFVNGGSNAAGQGSVLSVNQSNGHAELTGCTFEDNRAVDGGAFASQGTVTVKDCVFEGNEATDEGGAIRNHSGGVLYLVGSDFINNTGVFGGAVSMTGFTLISSCDFTHNYGKWGGALDARLGSARQCVVSSAKGAAPSTFTNNDSLAGDAIRMGDAGTLLVGNAKIEGTGDGVTIQADAGTLELNATKDDLARVKSTTLMLALEGGGTVQDYVVNEPQDARTTLNGTVGESGSVYVTEDHSWCDGRVTFAVEDLGRPEPVVALRDFASVPQEVDEHVSLVEGDAVALQSKDFAEGEGVDGVYVTRGGAVRFELDGGTIVKGAIDGYTAGVETYLPTQVVKTGFSFVGWFRDPTFAGSSVKSIPASETAKEVVLYAKWSEGKYWINYRPNGGSMPQETIWHRNINESVKLIDPVRADYTFIGWYPDSEFKKDEITSITAGTEGDVTIYARYDHHKDKGTKVSETKATCTADGSESWTYQCVDCKKPLETEIKVIPATGHTFGGWQTVAGHATGCDGKSLKIRTCSQCGYKETQLTEGTDIEAAGHHWGEAVEVKAATCASDGITTYTCDTCGAVKSESVPATGHDFEDKEERQVRSEAASCAFPAVTDIYQSCKTCHAKVLTKTETSEPTGHRWKTDYAVSPDQTLAMALSGTPTPQPNAEGWVVKVERNCATNTGEVRYRTCETCGFVETEEDSFDHLWQDEPTIDVEATCTQAGESSIHCSSCGARKDITKIAALGHDFSDTTYETCARCDVHNPDYVSEPTDEPSSEGDLGADHTHTWSEAWADHPAPSCTEPGVRFRYCTDVACGAHDPASMQSVAALGHQWEDDMCVRCWAKKPAPEDDQGAIDSADPNSPQTGDANTNSDANNAESASVTVLRLYNSYTGEHLFTVDEGEYAKLGSLGWDQEGSAWCSPQQSATPIYRLYNSYNGDHHYTTNISEYQVLGSLGWKQEGAVFYSDDGRTQPVYRLFNDYLPTGKHLFTTNTHEYNTLGTSGWQQEQIGWYALPKES